MFSIGLVQVAYRRGLPWCPQGTELRHEPRGFDWRCVATRHGTAGAPDVMAMCTTISTTDVS